MGGLQLLGEKCVVFGLPRIDKIDFCESRVIEKQTRRSFFC